MERPGYKKCTASTVLILMAILFLMTDVLLNRVGSNEKTLMYKPATKRVFHSVVDVDTVQPITGKFGSTQWRRYMPEIDDLLTKIEKNQVEWPVDIKLTTDPKNTAIVFGSSMQLQVGQKLKGTIQARDFKGREKQYGGDYFRGRLLRLDNKGNQLRDGVAVFIQDFYNGTYEWKTVVPWPGQCRLIVELVHSSEAVVELTLKRATLVNRNRGFMGKFANGKSSECDVMLRPTEGNSICDFSNATRGITWHCYKPPGLDTCPKSATTYSITTKDGTVLGSQPLFKKGVTWQTEILNSGLSFQVNGTIDEMPRGLMKCDTSKGSLRKNTFALKQPRGYFYQDRWVSMLCDNSKTSTLRECLKHKSLHLIGDSTIRQWYYSIQERLELQDTGHPNKDFWSMPRKGIGAKDDIYIYYTAHGNPLYNPGPPIVRPFIVDTLLSINGSRPTAVVLNIGGHFLCHDPAAFIQRVVAIKNAVMLLHERHPTVKFFIKGATRFTSSRVTPLSDWLYLRTDRILRAYFYDMPYVAHIDTWEMTFNPGEGLHAPTSTVEKFIDQFVSYFC